MSLESKFSELDLKDNLDGTFTLLKRLSFVSSILGLIDVPVGFQTDLASIPQIFQNIIPKVGRYDAAAVVHDYLYRYGHCTKAQADSVFLEGMTDLGVSYLTGHVIYLAVRLGGGLAWKEDRETNS